MGIARWAGAMVISLFVYIGSTNLFNSVVTGSGSAEAIITNFLPIALACGVLFVVVRLFTG